MTDPIPTKKMSGLPTLADNNIADALERFA
jgi:hypothetical protein